MKKFKLIELTFYFVLTTIILGILSIFPTYVTHYAALFIVGFTMRIYFASSTLISDGKKARRFSFIYFIYKVESLISLISVRLVRYLLRVSFPYILLLSFTKVIDSNMSVMLVLIGSISYDISLIALGKYDYQMN